MKTPKMDAGREQIAARRRVEATRRRVADMPPALREAREIAVGEMGGGHVRRLEARGLVVVKKADIKAWLEASEGTLEYMDCKDSWSWAANLSIRDSMKRFSESA